MLCVHTWELVCAGHCAHPHLQLNRAAAHPPAAGQDREAPPAGAVPLGTAPV